MNEEKAGLDGGSLKTPIGEIKFPATMTADLRSIDLGTVSFAGGAAWIGETLVSLPDVAATPFALACAGVALGATTFGRALWRKATGMKSASDQMPQVLLAAPVGEAEHLPPLGQGDQLAALLKKRLDVLTAGAETGDASERAKFDAAKGALQNLEREMTFTRSKLSGSKLSEVIQEGMDVLRRT